MLEKGNIYVEGRINVALIQCRECGKEISDAAPACPYCGRPSTQQTQYQKLQESNAIMRNRRNIVGLSFLCGLAVFVICIIFCDFFTASMIGMIVFAILMFITMGISEYRIKHGKPGWFGR